MTTSDPVGVYRPQDGSSAAQILVELERHAVVRAEMPGSLVCALAAEPALPLADLSALRSIVCTDSVEVPDSARRVLGVTIERAPTVSEPMLQVDPDQVAFSAARAAEKAVSGLDMEAVLSFTANLDRAALLTMLHALDIPSCGADTSAVLAPVSPEYHPLVRRWLAALAEHGLVSRDGEVLQALRVVDDVDLSEAWASVDRDWCRVTASGCGGNPSAQPPPGAGSLTLAYARRSAEMLPGLMRGTVSAMSLLFPGGSLDTAAAIYREAPVAQYQLAGVAGALSALAGALPADRTLRVLEVGAGTGATTDSALAALAEHPVSYLFTDLGRTFLQAAQERLGPRGVRVARFDIDGSEEQKVGTGEFDVVIAGGVLNNARSTDHSLRILSQLLAPGGWLLITEPTQEVQWIAMSQAFLMTSATDDRQTTGRTFLSHAQWRAAFDRLPDMSCVLDLPPVSHPLSVVGQRVFGLRRTSGRCASGDGQTA